MEKKVFESNVVKGVLFGSENEMKKFDKIVSDDNIINAVKNWFFDNPSDLTMLLDDVFGSKVKIKNGVIKIAKEDYWESIKEDLAECFSENICDHLYFEGLFGDNIDFLGSDDAADEYLEKTCDYIHYFVENSTKVRDLIKFEII